MAALGLVKGYVLRLIDGRELRGLQDAADLLDRLGRGDRLTLHLQRDGVLRRLRYYQR